MNQFWQEKLLVGNTHIPRFMTAPMDGITDSPFRQLIRQYSPDILMFGEMTHVASISHRSNNPALRFSPAEQPFAFQISTNKTDFIERAIEILLTPRHSTVIESNQKQNTLSDTPYALQNDQNQMNFQKGPLCDVRSREGGSAICAGLTNKQSFSPTLPVLIDLNAGCPARQVINSGTGSALMADLPRLIAILTLLKKTIAGRVPLSIKIRAGFKEKNALDVALAAQDCGVDMLTIHPRTQPEGFTGPLDYELVARVKQRLTIPVIYCGNITSAARVQKVYETTGVDGFMIGRALYGAPWKVEEIMWGLRSPEDTACIASDAPTQQTNYKNAAQKLRSKTVGRNASCVLTTLAQGARLLDPEVNIGICETNSNIQPSCTGISSNEAIQCAIKHLELNLEHYGPSGMHKIKKMLPQYIKGVKDAAQIRSSLLRINNSEAMRAALTGLLGSPS